MRRIVVPGLVALAAAFGVPAATSAAVTPAHAAKASAASAAPAVPAPTAPAAAPAAAAPKHLLVSVSCKAAKSCVAVGADVNTNRPMAEVWNGAKWAGADLKLPAGVTLGTLDWVSCTAVHSCVAVGLIGATPFAGSLSAEAPLAETWNGKSWAPSQPPAPSGSHGSQLGGVSCPAAKMCVATGLYFLGNGNAAGQAADARWRPRGVALRRVLRIVVEDLPGDRRPRPWR